MSKIKYNYEDVRILREGLSRAARVTRNNEGMISALAQFAMAVRDYCDHPEVVAVEDHDICLNCGFKKLIS